MKDLPVVLFLIDTLNTGGAEKSLLDITSRLQRYRAVVCYIYRGDALRNDFEKRGVEVRSLQVPPPYHWRAATRAVSEVVAEVRPVIIHSSLFKSDIVSRRVAHYFKIPLINALVNNSYHASRFDGAGWIMRIKLRAVQWLDAWTSRRVDLFISNSEAIRQSNSLALGVHLDRIRVVYRGRLPKDFEVSAGSVADLRESLGLSPKSKVILNVSRLLSRKGQMDLVRAFKPVAEEHSDVLLLIVGEGAYRNALEDEISRLGLTDRVRMLGTRKDVPVLMACADCFVFPSYYEGLPGVLIEAMFSNLLIVASRIPENLECVDERSALLFDAGDVQGMTGAIHHALGDELSHESKRVLARQIALQKFEISAIVEQYEQIYDTFAGAPVPKNSSALE